MRLQKKEMVIALIDAYANGKNAQFAKLLGISPQTVSAWITRNTIDYDLVYTKCGDVSAEWLLSGEGEMRKTDAPAFSYRDAEKTIYRLSIENTKLKERIEELEGKGAAVAG